MIHVLEDAAEASRASAGLFVQTAREAVARNGRFTVALTGGSSPVHLYKLLAAAPYRDEVPWAQTFVFWGDERAVPHADDRNNARMAFDLLLDHVPVPPAQIHRMSGEGAPDESARQYEALLKAHFAGGPPQFDLGPARHGRRRPHGFDVPGHGRGARTGTVGEGSVPGFAANVPHHPYGAPAQPGPPDRVPGVRRGQAATLKRVLEGPYQPDQLPSQLIKPTSGELHWFLDEAAAGEIRRPETGGG
jgi:6-phosphogluconolactonase